MLRDTVVLAVAVLVIDGLVERDNEFVDTAEPLEDPVLVIVRVSVCVLELGLSSYWRHYWYRCE
jgi:hypothetical protein